MENKEIADRLKEARIKAGYKRAKDFAKQFNLSVPAYYHHENGTRNISLDILKKYAEWLNVHPAFLITGEKAYSDIKIANELSDEEFAELAANKAPFQLADLVNSKRLSDAILEIYDSIKNNKNITNHIEYAVKTAVDIYLEAVKTTRNETLQNQIIHSSIRGLLLGLKSKIKEAI